MRYVGEVIALDRDCDLGSQGERAVVVTLTDGYMALVFVDRAPESRNVRTGADYRYLRSIRDLTCCDRTCPGCSARECECECGWSDP